VAAVRVRVEQTTLPGIGVRHDLITSSGRRIGVVSHRNGRRDLVLYDDDDPDACRADIPLTDDEAEALADILGASLMLGQLSGLRQQAAGLLTEQISIPAGSPYVGRRLGDTKARTRTSASIVAVLREREVIASPDPTFRFELIGGGIALCIAVFTVVLVLVVAIRYGGAISAMFSPRDPEALLLGVLGLTLLVAGASARLGVSAAVGAFLVGIALSGPVAHHATEMLSPLRDLFAAVFFVFFGLATNPSDMPPVLLPALALAVVTMATKVVTGYLAARRVGIAVPGRWRAGFGLMPRGEFSIVIAGLAVTSSGIEPRLAPLATAYVLITVVAGPLLARLPDSAWFKARLRRQATVRRAEPVPTAD
jgi:K+/H+ antiporter YhaU regulatory subunit KhtT